MNSTLGYVLKDTIIVPYGPQFAKREKLIRSVVEKYFATYGHRLAHRGPVEKLPFTGVERINFFQAVGISTETIEKTQKELQSENYNEDWSILGDPLLILLVCVIQYFYTSAKTNKKAHHYEMAQFLTFFAGARMYGSLQYKYWKNSCVEGVMDYTIEHLSDKSYAKKMNSMYEVLAYMSNTNVDNMGESLTSNDDKSLLFYITNLYSRLNSMMKNISRDYYANHAAGNAITKDNIMKDDDEGDSYVDAVKTVSADIDRVARSITIKLSSDSMVDMRLLEIATMKTRISASNFATLIKNIQAANDPVMGSIVRNVLSVFLVEHEVREIRSKTFIVTMQNLYRTSHTNDEFVIGVKKMLDDIINRYGADYLKSASKSTLSGVRYSIFAYIILYINKYVE